MLNNLFACIADRAKSEQEVRAQYEDALYAAEQEFGRAQAELTENYQHEQAATQQDYATCRDEATKQFESQRDTTQSEHEATLREIENRFESETSGTKQQQQEALWEATAVYEATEQGLKHDLQNLKKRRQKLKDQIVAASSQVESTHEAAVELLLERRMWPDTDAELPPGEPAGDGDPLARLSQLATEAEAQYDQLHNQVLGQLFMGFRPLLVFLPFWLLAVFPTVQFFQVPWSDPRWIIVSGAVAAALTALTCAAIYPLARNQAREAYLPLRRMVDETGAVQQEALGRVEAEYKQRHKHCEEQLAQALEKRRRETTEAESCLKKVLATTTQTRDSAIRKTEDNYAASQQELTERRDQQLQEIEQTYPRRLAQLEKQFERDKQAISNAKTQRVAQITLQRDQQWEGLTQRWRQGLAGFRDEVERTNAACREIFPDWNHLATDGWSPPQDIPAMFAIGGYDVDLRELEHGIPEDERLVPDTTRFALPVLLAFPEEASVLIRADGPGRARAIDLMQLIMLRLLVVVPPGRLRFTVIDPVGLGEKFSGFMHLADYDELLMNSRIWTESNHIEQRLADLTEHMENVFQKYLRNEFPSIQAYNEQAGEVAEPYHFLVVANFPVNFSENAARRLNSIITSGPRCGVYTLISVDTKQRMPLNFDLADVAPHMTTLQWRKNTFFWRHPELGAGPFTQEELPEPDQLRTIVRRVGHQSKDARRVEVAFERVAPSDDQFWCEDSRQGIDVPLGRAGATMLQNMRLGSGTSQHVMIAGKTGSGKSTLLHVMVTNLALYYGPEQVEFYLIDFKKGVEFKTYAAHALPHARVVAIESDREFGLSVLEHLDAVLNQRGELFRQHGVQDLAGYRKQMPEATLPRILLLIDEFQEFFTEDDRVAQQSALLLDRLVRQGRAFGIHVVLGSQTLSGAYTLARSTLGQVGVRIALECSETDAHVILSDENTAARLLTRPGEAIYNDANGRLEGNHPFQTAWLPDHQRDDYLRRLGELSAARGLTPQPPIVFEGNVPADPATNPALTERLAAAAWPEAVLAPRVWLGAPVSIKDPVAVQLRRQSAANVLVIGRDEQAAAGLLVNCLISLAAQHAPGKAKDDTEAARFVILDGAAPDAAPEISWRRIKEAIPHSVELVGPPEVQQAIAACAAELARRQEQAAETAVPMYLFIYNLARFRDLRRSEDDFGFSFSEEKPAAADKQLVEIIREGPALGMHTIVWCDTYTNLDRWLARRALHDFEIRVLFQMSSADSSQLVDGPAAAKLGPNRALLYLEEKASTEKFRPYRPPSPTWLAEIKRLLDRPVDLMSS